MSKAEDPKSEDLKYVGDGAYLNGVPARDLTAAEIEDRGLKVADLRASGLYEPAKQKPAKGKE